MPALAGRRSEQVTSLLVTAEVNAFVVGPAVGGLLLGPLGGTASVAPTPVAAGRGHGLLADVTRAPGALRALVAVAVVNAVEAALGLALVTLTVVAWRSGETDYGLATAALGFGALAAPLLHRLARGFRVAVLLTGCALVAVALTPSVVPALLPLALDGTAGTQVECEATAVLQCDVPDRVRAFALGLADTVMVTAAMVGAALAPWLASAIGPRALVVLLAVATATLLPLTRIPASQPREALAVRT